MMSAGDVKLKQFSALSHTHTRIIITIIQAARKGGKMQLRCPFHPSDESAPVMIIIYHKWWIPGSQAQTRGVSVGTNAPSSAFWVWHTHIEKNALLVLLCSIWLSVSRWSATKHTQRHSFLFAFICHVCGKHWLVTLRNIPFLFPCVTCCRLCCCSLYLLCVFWSSAHVLLCRAIKFESRHWTLLNFLFVTYGFGRLVVERLQVSGIWIFLTSRSKKHHLPSLQLLEFLWRARWIHTSHNSMFPILLNLLEN